MNKIKCVIRGEKLIIHEKNEYKIISLPKYYSIKIEKTSLDFSLFLITKDSKEIILNGKTEQELKNICNSIFFNNSKYRYYFITSILLILVLIGFFCFNNKNFVINNNVEIEKSFGNNHTEPQSIFSNDNSPKGEIIKISPNEIDEIEIFIKSVGSKKEEQVKTENRLSPADMLLKNLN